ncbi:TonB-dependent receptor [Actinobacillus pleuropneumoniae]|uniref:TonB-dependent receptor n=1 Tax=Actinobacillus pleuropneumoniae TaxID=715 RepID=UPI003B02BAA1
MFNKKLLAVLISAQFSPLVWANNNDVAVLDEVSVVGSTPSISQGSEVTLLKVSDKIIAGKEFKKRSATLGNALAAELGVHSNPFGGGASKPIIRGQEGARIRILQNGSDVIDMSNLSPDHAVVADSLLAKQVEILRGSSTLLYASSSPAGIVNVVDKRIPTEIPEKGYEVELNSRFDTAAKEKVGALGATFGIGKHIAVRAEGLTRHSDNYRVPGINLGERLNYVPDTYNKSKVGTLGLSFVGEQGYIGASYSKRRDNYGLPGHNHKFDFCIGHIYGNKQGKYAYTYLYPHLIGEENIGSNPHFHCGTDHAEDGTHSHDNPFGHDHDHTHPGPWVDLESKRFDVKAELRQPFKGIDKIKVSYADADYYHDEKDAGVLATRYHKQLKKDQDYGKPVNIFKNRGKNARLEIYHAPLGGLTGVWGVQYQTQKSSMHAPKDREVKFPLVENTNKQMSLFGIEQYMWDNFALEFAGRVEKQKIEIEYDRNEIKRLQDHYRISGGKQVEPDLSPYNQNAYAYSSTLNWFFHPDYQLSFTASHNERFPTPMELYYHGQHIATNSFEYGNKDLKKEQSNNVELGLGYQTERVGYKVNVYYNHFKNYIYNENLFRENQLFMRRYNQAKARFYGIEAEASYRFNDKYQATIFGDMVRGWLTNLPPLTVNSDYSVFKDYLPKDAKPGEDYLIYRADQNTPRTPPVRLGFRFNAEFTPNWSGDLELIHTFTQRRTSQLEYITEGNTMLNIGVAYSNKWKDLDYKISLNGTNLLNQPVYIHTSYHQFVPQTGRNFILVVNVKF